MKGRAIILPLFVSLLMTWSCETGKPLPDQPESPQPVMSYSVSEVAQIRTRHNLDQRAMSIEGVLSVGVAGNSDDDAWFQIQCKDAETIAMARSELGDSLAGVPIHFTISDTIRAQ